MNKYFVVVVVVVVVSVFVFLFSYRAFTNEANAVKIKL